AIADARLHHASVLAVIGNRAEEDLLSEIRAALAGLGQPAYVIPEIPVLGAPTVGQLAGTVSGRQVYGSPSALDREALQVTLAAGSLDHDLAALTDGAVVVVSGDRPDVLLGLAFSQAVSGFPRLAGLVVTGSYTIAKQLVAVMGATMQAAGADLAVVAVPDQISSVTQRLLAAPGNATSFS